MTHPELLFQLKTDRGSPTGRKEGKKTQKTKERGKDGGLKEKKEAFTKDRNDGGK